MARALVGWGVRNITLIDNGRVSYSNPARQCLFEFADAEAGRYKSDAAAAALKRVWGEVNANSVVMTIPMPGHPLSSASTTSSSTGTTDVTSESEEEAAINQLDELVKSHDVCFALTDSREARLGTMHSSNLNVFSAMFYEFFVCFCNIDGSLLFFVPLMTR